ncbi:hypothetical protein FKF97_03010 [Clostridium perfringens]|nr:hypothetical protein [Clostridium perfringens]
MLNNSIEQNANNSNFVNQAGNDIYNYFLNQVPDFEFYEQDIKEVILFFSESIKNDNTFINIDFDAIKIKEKNKINHVSKECNELIVNKSLPKFGKINSFLTNPANEEYLTMYNSITFELQQLILGQFTEYKSFDNIFSSLYQHIIKNAKSDHAFMKVRTNVLVFLHFMYYNCDIGKKYLEGDEFVAAQ